MGFNLNDAERRLCVEALTHAGSIVVAAQMLGITRHALKRRIIKHHINWPRAGRMVAETSAVAVAPAVVEPAPVAAATTPPIAEWLLSQLEAFLPARMRNEDLGDAREHIADMVARGASSVKIWCQVLLVIWWTILKLVKGPGGRR